MKDLKKVNWQTLKGCYGFAEEVPESLKQLSSSDPTIRQTAFEKLTDQIYHQGSIYEVTPYVVPFLIELLSNPLVQDKDNILSLLWLVTMGRPAITDQNEWLKPILESEGRDFDHEVKFAKSYVEATKEEIRKGLSVYLRLLNDESPKVRIESARLLLELPQDWEIIFPRLRSHVHADENENAKAMFIWTLGNLLESTFIPISEKVSYTEFFSEIIGSAEGNLVKLAASISQLKVAGNHASPEAINFLIESASQPNTYPDLPWLDVALWTACDALSELTGEKRIAVFEQLLARSDKAEAAHDIIITLLNRIFRGKDAKRWDLGIDYNLAQDGTREWRYITNYDVKPIRKLTQEQKSILRIILNCEQFWEIRNNLLEAYGLPGSRDELRQFLVNISES